MNGGRVAIVLTDEAQDCADWRDANRTWLGRDGAVFFTSPEGGPLRRGDDGEPTAAPSVATGFLLTRPDWRIDPAFGDAAQAGGFAAATGRLMAKAPARNIADAFTFNDIAPYLLSQHIEQFAISADYDGFLCARLPLEALWIGAPIAAETAGLLSDGDPAPAILDAFFASRRLSGGAGYAYLADMKALWRRASDIKTCASYGSWP